MANFFRVAWHVMRKDLTVEVRSREVLFTTLFFAGVNTDRCVFSTLQDANFLGYDCILVEDACATVSPQFVTDAIHYLVRLLHGAVASSGAILTAIAIIDGNATPAHRAELESARQLNAVIGIIGGGVLLAWIVLTGVRSWLRVGKDPVYLDDASVLMAGPPPHLTAASAAALMDQGSSRRALTSTRDSSEPTEAL